MKRQLRLPVKLGIIIGMVPAVCAVIAVLIFKFFQDHSTYYAYNDSFVIGSTASEIVERYGEFDKHWDNYAAYQVRENTPEWIMSYDDSLWYEIYFKDGVTYKVRLQKGWYGG